MPSRERGNRPVVDGGAVAITWAARALFAGLGVLSLALADWDGLVAALRSSAGDRSHDE